MRISIIVSLCLLLGIFGSFVSDFIVSLGLLSIGCFVVSSLFSLYCHVERSSKIEGDFSRFNRSLLSFVLFVVLLSSVSFASDYTGIPCSQLPIEARLGYFLAFVIVILGPVLFCIGIAVTIHDGLRSLRLLCVFVGNLIARLLTIVFRFSVRKFIVRYSNKCLIWSVVIVYHMPTPWVNVDVWYFRNGKLDFSSSLPTGYEHKKVTFKEVKTSNA